MLLVFCVAQKHRITEGMLLNSLNAHCASAVFNAFRTRNDNYKTKFPLIAIPHRISLPHIIMIISGVTRWFSGVGKQQRQQHQLRAFFGNENNKRLPLHIMDAKKPPAAEEFRWFLERMNESDEGIRMFSRQHTHTHTHTRLR